MAYSITDLEKRVKNIKIDLIKMLSYAGSGHTAGPLGLAEIMTDLYFNELTSKDKLILSCGHYVPIRYVVMAHRGILPIQELATLRKLGSNTSSPIPDVQRSMVLLSDLTGLFRKTSLTQISI